MSVGVSGYYPRTLDVRVFDGAPSTVTTRSVQIAFAQVGVDATENEFLQLFDQALPPAAGNVPKFSLGRLKKDVTGRGFYEFNLPGRVFFFNGLTLGISSTNLIFTPTANPTDYIVTIGAVFAP